MYVKLTVVEGDAKTPEIRLKTPAVIGRGRGASLQIPHALVSRQHCEILAIDGKLRIRDLGSLNGTLVDGQKITETELLSGQTLTIGALTFRVEYGEGVRFGEPTAADEKTIAAVPVADERSVNPKTDELMVDLRKELENEAASAELQEPAAGAGSGLLDFLVEESPADSANVDSLLPPVATANEPAQVPAAQPTPPVAPLAIPVAIPAVSPPALAVPAAAPPATADETTTTMKSEEDDEELRAFLRSLGKK